MNSELQELPKPDSTGYVSNDSEPGRLGNRRSAFEYQALAEPQVQLQMSPVNPAMIKQDCLRVRDLGRRHGFQISIADAEKLWRDRSVEAKMLWMLLPPGDDELIKEMTEGLHRWCTDNEVPTPAPVQQLSQHIPIIALADGPCDICQRWELRKTTPKPDGKFGHDFHCDDCGGIIPDMGGQRGRGCSGTIPHHYHLKAVNGGPMGREGIFQELCHQCFVNHRARCYPDRPVGKMFVDGKEVRVSINA